MQVTLRMIRRDGTCYDYMLEAETLEAACAVAELENDGDRVLKVVSSAPSPAPGPKKVGVCVLFLNHEHGGTHGYIVQPIQLRLNASREPMGGWEVVPGAMAYALHLHCVGDPIIEYMKKEVLLPWYTLLIAFYTPLENGQASIGEVLHSINLMDGPTTKINVNDAGPFLAKVPVRIVEDWIERREKDKATL